MANINQVKLKQDADAAERAGRLDKAIEALRQIVQGNARDWATINRIGDLYGKLNEPKAANEQYVKIAKYFAEDGFYLKAIAVWKKILRNEPSLLDGHVSLGELYQKQGLIAEARQTFQFVHDEYLRQNRLPEAGEVLRRLAEMDSSDMERSPRSVPSDRDEPTPLNESPVTPQQSRTTGVPTIDLDHYEADPSIIRVIPAETARKYQVLPLSRSGGTLTVAMADPTNVFAADDIKFMTGYSVQPVVASAVALAAAVDRYYGPAREPDQSNTGLTSGRGDLVGFTQASEVSDGPTLSIDDLAAVGGLSEIDVDALSDSDADGAIVKAEEDAVDLANLARSADAAPIVKLVNVLLVDSLKRGASDIHIEPYEKEFRVRFRIDGILYNVMALPLKLRDLLVSRVKLMAKLDIAEKRLPQDGRIKIKMKVEDRSRDLDFRVSSLPTLWGEKTVLRMLDKSSLMLDMTKLGFEAHSLERFKTAISKPHGIVLVTGPTDSGKTTTLYSAIAALNIPDRNIMTAEDPVEFNLPGVNQVQIREQIGLNFAAVLRSFLRQDPNVILVGAIRDDETTEAVVSVATRMSYLLLASMNEPDAASAVEAFTRASRRPFQVARTLRAVVAQRLVRRLCVNCRNDFPASAQPSTPAEVSVGSENVVAFPVAKGRGCGKCNGTGYRGRVGLFEVLEVTPGIRSLIEAGATAAEIRKKAVEQGMLTLHGSGLQKVKDGMTTMEEVLREAEP